MDRLAAFSCAALGIGAALALSGSSRETGAHAPSASTPPAWTEVGWPFGPDPWGKGRAFRCRGGACGAETTVYLRAKFGLCNCATGIEGDSDLDRMGDLYLLGDGFAPAGEGRPIAVGHMKGRSRFYGIAAPAGHRGAAIAIGYSDRCDMVVATARLAGGRPEALEPALLDFLGSAPVMRWTEAALGL